MPMIRDFDLRLSNLQRERLTFYLVLVFIVLLAPVAIVTKGFTHWRASLKLARENLKQVAKEEARLRAVAPHKR